MCVHAQINLVHPMYSNVTMKALTDCELFAITHEALDEILVFYPEGKLYMSISICCAVQARVEIRSGSSRLCCSGSSESHFVWVKQISSVYKNIWV